MDNTATRVVTVELGAAGNPVWTHPGGFATYHEARTRPVRAARGAAQALGRGARQAQGAGADVQAEGGLQRRAWPARYQAAQTRLRKFEEAGPPTEQPREQKVKMRLKGGRTGKRAVVCEDLELTGLMKAFDLEVWYGERVAVLGSNGSGKSHFLRLLAAGRQRPRRRAPAGRRGADQARRPHRARPSSARGCGPAGSCRPTSIPSCVGRTLLEILHRGDDHRDGMPREQAARVLDRYELAHASEQKFESLSGGQQARLPDPAARAVRRHAAAARRADRQPRRRVGRGAGGGAGGLRGHGDRGHPRPLVRPRLRPVPGLRRRRRRSTSPTGRSGTRAGSSAPADHSQGQQHDARYGPRPASRWKPPARTW